MHPREWNRDVQFRGRVRVQLKQEDGSLCQDKFTSRKSTGCLMCVSLGTHGLDSWAVTELIWSVCVSPGKDVMFYVAEMIPKLKTRTQKSGGGDSNSQQADGGKKNKKKKK